MRALCGAIITAGALIGLGLTALGIGTRYGSENPAFDSQGNPLLVRLSAMDRPLLYVLIFLSCVAVIGLGISFVGLAYHHWRRHHEHIWEKERMAAQHRPTV